MTVTVTDLSGLPDGPVRVVAVTVSRRCPRCGRPRGEPYPVSWRESDGTVIECYRWSNPCGHTDLYRDVLIEAGKEKR